MAEEALKELGAKLKGLFSSSSTSRGAFKGQGHKLGGGDEVCARVAVCGRRSICAPGGGGAKMREDHVARCLLSRALLCAESLSHTPF